MKKLKIAIFMIVVVLILAGIFVLSTFKIETVKYEGNERVSEEEMELYVFKDKYDKNPFVFYYKVNFKEQPEIPFVDRYDVEINSLNSVTITVYEKDMIGCVKYMGAYLYFDKDGIVVESSDVKQEDIPLVTGISFEYFILDSKLPVENEEIFDKILGITQQLSKYGIEVDKLDINQNIEISLCFDDVVVELGKDDETMNDKIVDLSDMKENLKGLSGTLNMKEYDASGAGYTFKKNK